MSSMPVTPGPVSVPGTPATDLLAAASGAVALGNAPASETGAGFLALVQQALHLVDGEAAPGQAGTGDVAQDDTATEDQDASAAESGDLAAALVNVLPLIPGLPVTPAAAGTGDAPAAEVGAVAAATNAPSAPALAAVPATTAREAKAEPAADAGAPAPDAPTAAPTAASTTDATPAPATTTPAPTATTAAPATAATAPVSAPAAAPATPALDPVSTQVVDRITSMVDRGTGTHRVTMKLNPEQLGEVRIVMTVRDGAVHVRLAASEHQAHQSLVEGSAELNRLLEAAGATDARITVRETGRAFSGDLGSSQNSSNGWASGSSTTDPGAGEGRASDRSPNEHAGTRAEQVATDGTQDPRRFAAGTTGTRSNESVTSSRATGLDVTM